MKCILRILLPIALLASGAHSQDAPAWPIELWDYYGDSENVRRLTELLESDDPALRDQVLSNLAQTHHPDAVEPIRKALADTSVPVRMSAVRAAAELPADAAGDVLADGLADRDPTVVSVSLAVIRLRGRADMGPKVVEVLARPQPWLRAAALETATTLRHPVQVGLLKQQLASDSPAVRLAAARHAALLTRGETIVPRLVEMAGSDGPAQRAAAIEALGKLAWTAQQDLIVEALSAGQAVVRAGAVAALGHAGASQGVLERLRDDPSYQVRLVAARVAGQQKISGAVEPLLEMLLSGIEQRSEIAVQALVSIDETAAAAAALEALRTDLARVAGSIGTDQYALVSSRITASCELLARMEYQPALETINQALDKATLVDQHATDLARVASRIGNERTGQIMTEKVRNGEGLALAIMLGRPNVPFSDEIAASLVRALGEMGYEEATGPILQLARAGRGQGRLRDSVSAALDALSQVQATALLDGLIVDVLSNELYGAAQAYHAAVLAGRRKLSAAADPLEKLVVQTRRHPQEMAAAAWAHQQITGRALELPDPKPAESESWILRRVP